MKKALVIGMVILGLVILTGCEAWERTKKEWDSNYGSGQGCELTIYSGTKEELTEYEGKFNLSCSNGRIEFKEDGGVEIFIQGISDTAIQEEKQDL